MSKVDRLLDIADHTACRIGLSHFQADQIPGLTLVGIVLGVLHVKTKRSLANMAAHATFNLLTVLSLWKLGIPGIA